MAIPKKPVPMCCVTISYMDFLMPFADGVKLVQLMQTAVECQKSYEMDSRYMVKDQPRVEFCAVKNSEIVMPSGALRLTDKS